MRLVTSSKSPSQWQKMTDRTTTPAHTSKSQIWFFKGRYISCIDRYFGVVSNKPSIQVGVFFQQKIRGVESNDFPTKGNAFNPSNPWLRSAYSALGAVRCFFFGGARCLPWGFHQRLGQFF